MKKILLLLLLSKMLVAINLVPMTETLDNKKKKNIVFKVSNTSNEPVAVAFNILKLLDTDNNKEERVETETVQAYPAQFILSPNETKSVRVRYMGSELPDIEEVYRIIAQELDIDVSDKQESDTNGKVKAEIKMRFSYEGLLFVHKENVKANLNIENMQKTSTVLSVNMKNSGTRSAVPTLAKYNYFANMQGKEYQLTEDDLRGTEFRRVLAGKTNTFNLAHITTVPVQQIDSIRIEKK